MDEDGALPSFCCPISSTLMVDPHINVVGQTYEKKEIELWYKQRLTDPNTNQTVSSSSLIPNHALKAVIREWRDMYNEHKKLQEKLQEKLAVSEKRVRTLQSQLTRARASNNATEPKARHISAAASDRDNRAATSLLATPSRLDSKHVFKQKSQKRLMERDRKLNNEVQRAKDRGVGSIPLDVVFVIDCTQSMKPHIQAAKTQVSSVISGLRKKFTRANLRIAVIGYRDIEDQKPREILRFTDDQKVLHVFLNSLRAEANMREKKKENGEVEKYSLDDPEDLTGALHDACNIGWQSRRKGVEVTRVAIIIADQPCHGTMYHNYGEDENHPEGDPRGRDPRQLVNSLKKKQVNLHFFRISHETDKMVGLLQKAYNDKDWVFHQHQIGDDTTLFAKLCIDSITRSISADSVRRLGSQGVGRVAFRRRKKKFTSIMKKIEEGEANAAVEDIFAPSAPRYEQIVISSSNESKAERAEVFTTSSEGRSIGVMRVTFPKEPFAVGAMRAAYRIQNHGVQYSANQKGCAVPSCLSEKFLVCKEGLSNGVGYNSREAMFGDLNCHHRARALADEWNQNVAFQDAELRPVRVLEPVVLHLADRQDVNAKWVMAESFLPKEAKFRKFNNNGGMCDRNEDAEAMNTFSHWTWCKSAGEHMVLDLQGVMTSEEVVLTDLQVMHPDRTQYGRGNLGGAGMAAFFAGHECGRLCKLLKLHLPGELDHEAAKKLSEGVGVVVGPQTVPAYPIERLVPNNADGKVWTPPPQAMAKPRWVPDHEVIHCMVGSECKRRYGSPISFEGFFPFRSRRHHCRLCGKVVCGLCSKNRQKTPWSKGKLERVCDDCVAKQEGVGGGATALSGALRHSGNADGW